MNSSSPDRETTSLDFGVLKPECGWRVCSVLPSRSDVSRFNPGVTSCPGQRSKGTSERRFQTSSNTNTHGCWTSIRKSCGKRFDFPWLCFHPSFHPLVSSPPPAVSKTWQCFTKSRDVNLFCIQPNKKSNKDYIKERCVNHMLSVVCLSFCQSSCVQSAL